MNGLHLLQNLELDELAAKRVYEFAFRDAAVEGARLLGIDGRSGRDPVTGQRGAFGALGGSPPTRASAPAQGDARCSR